MELVPDPEDSIEPLDVLEARFFSAARAYLRSIGSTALDIQNLPDSPIRGVGSTERQIYESDPRDVARPGEW